jgi:hypothetical protein
LTRNLVSAWALGVAAVAPFFVAVGIGTYALDPDADTAPAQLVAFALVFFASGAVVTTFAGTLLARSELYRWARAQPIVVPAIVGAALALVLPAFLAADEPGGVSLRLLVLASVELSIALTWLAAVRPSLALGATVVLTLALLIAAGDAS